MPFNTNEFRTSFKNGFAKKNLFDCQFTGIPIKLMQEQNLYAFQDMRLRCKMTELPGKRILTDERLYSGEMLLIPYAKAVTPINIEILDDADFTIKKMFDRWMSYIVRDEGNHEINDHKVHYYKNIVADKFVITLFNQEGRVPYRCTLLDVFPTTFVQTSFDWSENDTLATFGVELSYRGWTNKY